MTRSEGPSVVHANNGLAPAAPEQRSEHRATGPEREAEIEFEAFLNEHYASLLSFATWWGKDPDDADDALNKVMIHIGRNWSTIREPVAYARTAVTRAILNIRRDRGAHRYIPVPLDELPEQTQDTCDLDRLEGQEWVDGLLSKLPPTQRAVLSRYLDGLGMSEIAAELRKSESTIRKNLQLARDRLSPFVAEYDRRRPRPSGEKTTREDNR
jgi:RNA polymerase sigma factor (sigma-70 family)